MSKEVFGNPDFWARPSTDEDYKRSAEADKNRWASKLVTPEALEIALLEVLKDEYPDFYAWLLKEGMI